MELYRKTLTGIGEVDYQAGEAAQTRIDNLTKPLGALGVLEKIGVQLACIQGNPMPILGKKSGYDHGG